MLAKRWAPLIVLVAAGAHARAGQDVLSWVNDQILKKINISGSQVFGFHLHEVEGDRTTFNESLYYGDGDEQFTDRRSLQLNGTKLFGGFYFDVTMNNYGFSRPGDQRTLVGYERGWLKVEGGDINASLLNSNELVRFSRLMRGAQVQVKAGRFALRALHSEIRAQARTISITGTNSPGPYFLQAGNIVDGSVRVQLDGVEMVLGQDYTLDPYAGTITFLERTITPAQTIVVTYETIGLNQASGTVTGGGLSYQILPGVSIGLTHIQQAPLDGGGLREITELFQGFGAPNTPYFLQYPPLRDRPIRVTVDGVLQVEGVDYYFDPVNPIVFYFTRFMPREVTIRVTYTPTPEPGSFGNGKRQVTGVDVQWKIGGQGSLSFATAKSRLDAPLGAETGEAMAARFDYTYGRARIQSRWRSIPSSYIGIESTGFSRNEKGVDLTLRYDAGRGYNLELFGSDYRIGTPSFQGGGISTISGRTRDVRFSASYEPDETKSAYLTAWNSDGEYQGIPNEKFEVNAGYRHRAKRWTLDAGLVHTDAKSAKFATGGELIPTSAVINGARVSGTYRASDALHFTSRIGFNQIESDGKSSEGMDLSFTGVWEASEKLSLDLTLADTNSGGITSLANFTGGNGFGYGGNGFSGGGFNYGGSFIGTRSKIAQIHASWRPSDEFSIDAFLGHSRAEGDNLTNSIANRIGLTASWRPSNDTSLYASVDRTEVELVDGGGKSTSTSMSVSADQKFGKRLSAGAYFTLTSFGGAGVSGFDQTIASFDANLRYVLAARQSIFARGGFSSTDGYRADEQISFGLGYTYELLPGVNLDATYWIRRREGLDILTGQNSFRSNSLDIELRIDFASLRNRQGP